MDVTIRSFTPADIEPAIRIWNEVVEDGVAFPQTEHLTADTGMDFFLGQSYTGLACHAESGGIVGLYILHPNNVGRCGHIANASFAVDKAIRGQRIGEKLVTHCIEKARELQFRILQFNAVVQTNRAALLLYQKLGFVRLGVIPKGFLMKDGTYEDIIPHYYILSE